MAAPLFAVLVVVSMAGADPAGAASFVVPGPDFPDPVNVSQPVTARLGIGNFSTPPESSSYPTLTVSAIDLVAACGDSVPGCPGALMTDVFAVSASGTARSGPASCVGTWTITQTSPGIFRFGPPGGEGSLALATGGLCVVEYTVTARRVPSSATLPAGEAVQVASATFAAPGLSPRRVSGYDQTTVAPAPPTTTSTTTTTTTRPPTTTTSTSTTTTRPPTTTTTTRPPTTTSTTTTTRPPTTTTPSTTTTTRPPATTTTSTTTTTRPPTTTTTRPPTTTTTTRPPITTTSTTVPPPPDPPRVALVSANSAKVVHAPARPATPGSQLVQWSWTGGANQQWRLVPLGGDVYAIASVGTGMVVDAGATAGEGAAVFQSPWTGAVSQWWRVISLGGDSYVLVSMQSGKVLDVSQASLADGAPLIQWTWSGAANQIWVRVNL